ncbi:MAG: hemolysin family protein [Microbacteriaceae bacterium]
MIGLFVALSVILVAVGGLCAALDSAYTVVSRTDIHELAEERGGSTFLHTIADDLLRHVNALNFLRVLVETTAAILVTLCFTESGLGVWSALGWAVLVMTVTSFVLVGSSPRSVGRAHPLVLISATAGFVRLARILVGPLTSALVGVGNAVTPGRARVALSTERQLLSMVDDAADADVLEDEDRDLIHSIFEFGDTIVREVMIARTDMVTLESTLTIDDALGVFLEQGYSRMPVIGDDSDEILGIAYMKDVAAFVRRDSVESQTRTIRTLVRPALLIPEVKKADDTLRLLQAESNHLAMVVDEYGGIAGLVTMEDLIEEVLGDINDEYDDDDASITDLGDDSYRVVARVNIDELSAVLDIDIDEDDVDTVGGLFVKTLGRLPAVGDTVTVQGVSLQAERVDRRRGLIHTLIVKVEGAE